MRDTPYIHLFRTSEKCYMYDVNRDQIVETPESVYSDLLNDLGSEGRTDESRIWISNMKSKGFMKTTRVEETEHPDTGLLPFYLDNRLKQLILQVTQSCNLRCSYCIYSGTYENRAHSQKAMSMDTAIKSIDYLAEHSQDSKEVTISFYGGEPLLRFHFIQGCMSYAKGRLYGKPVRFNITTNGTLLTEEMIEFFVSENVYIMFSLDGPAKIHDRNRRFAATNEGSFSRLYKNISYIFDNYPSYYSDHVSFNAVIDTKDGFSDLNRFVLDNQMFRDSYYAASLLNSRYAINPIHANDTFTSEWNYESFKFFLSKLGKFPSRLTSPLQKAVFNAMCDVCLGRKHENLYELPKRWHHSGPCLPGAQRLFVTADGNLYPCERLSESSTASRIGNIESGIDIEKAKAILNIELLMKEKCRNCWAYRHCTICVGAVDGLTHLDGDIAAEECSMVRRSTEKAFKDYCSLVDLGYTFDDVKVTRMLY